jgi:endonuclease/exonuclease/phosphatase family metal-dependent hydrolase
MSKNVTSPFIRVMSYNIRFDNPDDGDNKWEFRRERVANLIRFHQPDLIGLQEALIDQIYYLHANLPQYEWYGVGREDGHDRGEFSPVLYLKSRFTLLSKGTFWLSPYADQPSKGWDADIFRVCSWVKLLDTQSNQEFYHFNTHLDHLGKQARRESALLLQQRMINVSRENPAVLTGDFNDPPNSDFYKAITADNLMLDAKLRTILPHYGPDGTWATFDVTTGIGNQIDFIFVSPQIKVYRHGILTDSLNLKYASDHLPIMADLQISPD